MDNTPIFSQRYGLTPSDAPITIRNEAPEWLRSCIIDAAYRTSLRPSILRSTLCGLLLEPPDINNWSEYPNIDREVRGLLAGAEWFHVYDFIEDIYDKLNSPDGCAGFGMLQKEMEQFTNTINNAFHRKGVGWQLVEGRIEIRGEESFESSVRAAIKVTEETGRDVACRELHEALSDLSKRPLPDITGAIQHAMAALECAGRDISGNPKATLGGLIKEYPNMFPPPLGQVVEKLWGFTSEKGRHLREGGAPNFEEAELVVGLVGTLVTYLVKKVPSSTS